MIAFVLFMVVLVVLSVAFVVGLAIFGEAVVEPFIANMVNKWFLWRGRPECLQCQFTVMDKDGKPIFTAAMPSQALERIVAQLPDHAAAAAMDGVVMERVPQQDGESQGVALPEPPGTVVTWPAGD